MLREFTIEIATETDCVQCGETIDLSVVQCPNCDQYSYRIGFDDFFAELEAMRIMDARFGGLVLGRDGPEDDIPMYSHSGASVFSCEGLMQGGEYIMSRAAATKYGELLLEINAETGSSVPLSAKDIGGVRTIDTNLMPPVGGLWIRSPQFIVNRFATRKHLSELDRLNTEAIQEQISKS